MKDKYFTITAKNVPFYKNDNKKIRQGSLTKGDEIHILDKTSRLPSNSRITEYCFIEKNKS